MEALPIHYILVPVDFSDPSHNALATAIAMGRRQQASLHLLNVLDPTETNSQSPLETLDEQVRTQTEAIRELARQTTLDHQIQCAGECRVGSVSTEIVAAAGLAKADLIVMGTHGSSGIRAFYIGSEAYRVIKTAPCPVLTVPAHQSWTTFEQILFPVRPVPGALEKYNFARRIIQQNNAELTVLALHPPDEIISIDQLQQQIAALDEQFARDNVRSRTLFCPTDLVAETVLQKADELQADLLIITATLDTTQQDFFIGPFTQQIVHNAHVPVLSIRPQSYMQHPERVKWQYDWRSQHLRDR
ncbi:putative protein MJ0531 [Fibrisoma limi BUZ 3]|uniref:UspA domain-containing protein n=1 Tax=Fibrisoma limi BUZ 3 TaxID=1185876 RepID=I2GPX0_9BACT|nr:universal stress protein [Fibrisoma limi]CCH55948.1 putative protein MJ0531 [Fibrisoma limi BUZ 3]